MADHSGRVAESVAFSAAMGFKGDISQTKIPDNLKIKNYRSDVIDIFFDKGVFVEGKPIVPTLFEFVENVYGIIVSTETVNI